MTKRKYALICAALFAIALIVGGLTTAGFLARYWWFFDMAAQFRAAYLLLLAPLALTLLFLGRPRMAGIVTCFALANLVLIVPLYIAPAPAAGATSKIWRAAQINVFVANESPDRVIDYIKRYRPDFVVLEEIDQPWLRRLARLKSDYPYLEALPRNDAFGTAILSRRPLKNTRFVSFGAGSGPSVFTEITLGRESLTVLGFHPPPPRIRASAHNRNEQMKAAASFVSSGRGARMILGDFNSTSWSPFFRDMMEISGLRDSRRGFGLQPTWPATLPIPVVAIDHGLVSKELVVRRRRVGPRTGSDHLPVLIDFSFAPRR